LVQDLSS